MSYSETEVQRAARILRGRIAIVLCLGFWIASAGGIIMMININQ